MTTPPDKLFRQGLENYQKPAPGSAWERIESGLGRKRNRSPWMKIAAGLFLLIATSVVILQVNKTETAVATVSNESAPVTLNPDSAIATATEKQEIGDRRQEAVSSRQSSVDSSQFNSIVERSRNNQLDVVKKNLPVVERSRNEPGRNSLQSAVPSPQSSVAIHNSVTPDESDLTVSNKFGETNINPSPLTQVEITNEISTPNVASNSKRTSITYTAAMVNAKYLKKESTAEATPEKKNTSGLQKVIDLALDLKNEGSVLGDIREKKNEWLSFNGPSNKRETNK